MARVVIPRAVERGAKQRSMSVWTWAIAGRCEAPVTVELEYRADDREFRARGALGSRSYFLDIEAPCRKCRRCLGKRAAVWSQRAVSEVIRSPRTWFITLTLRPEEHYKAGCKAAVRLKARGVVFEDLPAHEQLRERHREVGIEITKYLKRVRKTSGSRFRYCIVMEAHKSGLPHYHLLLHEIAGELPIRHKVLSGHWALGYNQIKLVRDTLTAKYVCKYLAKSNLARVRASIAYGEMSQQGETVVATIESRSSNIDPSEYENPVFKPDRDCGWNSWTPHQPNTPPPKNSTPHDFLSLQRELMGSDHKARIAWDTP